MTIILSAVLLLILTGRSLQEDYVAEIFLVVDEAAMSRYVAESTADTEADRLAEGTANLNNDKDYFLTQVNDMFSSAQTHGLNIQVKARDFVVLDFNVFSDIDYLGKADAFNGLTSFQAYLDQNDIFASSEYDMAVLWTGFDLKSQDKGSSTAGYARVGVVCQQTAIGLVELDMTHSTAITTAHEVAHILGADHDECECDNGFVMSEGSEIDSDNRWYFSSCSVSDINDTIAKLDLPGESPNCLVTTNAASTFTPANADDEMLDPTNLCVRAMDDVNSYMCLSSNLYDDMTPQGDIVCKGIYCKVSGFSSCSKKMTTEGFICGPNERCEKGSCQPAPSSFPVEETLEANCLYGDEVDCTDHFEIDGNRGDCYLDYYATRCCTTCKLLNTSIEGCEYGDHACNCADYSENSVCPYYKDHLCCYYCRDWSEKRSADQEPTGPAPKLQLKKHPEVQDTDQPETKQNNNEVKTTD